MSQDTEPTLPASEPPARLGFWDSPRHVLSAAIAITLLFLAFVLLFAPLSSAMARVRMTVALGNMRDLQTVTRAMAEDGPGWPGDTGGSFTNWATQLIQGKYLCTNDLTRMLSMPGHYPPYGQMPAQNSYGVLVYAVGSNSPDRTVFLTTWNFANTPTGGSVSTPRAPLASNPFALVRRDGSAQILPGRAAGHPDRVGAYAPLLK